MEIVEITKPSSYIVPNIYENYTSRHKIKVVHIEYKMDREKETMYTSDKDESLQKKFIRQQKGFTKIKNKEKKRKERT